MGARLASCALVAALSLGSFSLRAEAQQVSTPDITGSTGVLADATDGRVLWEKDSRVRRPPASTTKILTAILVLERAQPDESVTISAAAEAVGAGEQGPNPTVQLNLVRGESMSVRQLLYGLLLESANDAAIALAEHVAGSPTRFVEMMNLRAVELGARDTHFVNPHGLDAVDHFSTAFDLMLFGKEAMSKPVFREIAQTRVHEFPGFGARPPQLIENRNKLLGTYPGAQGVKTGFTTPAGRSIVALAERDGESRIAVVLGSPDDAHPDAARLLDYGFQAFERRRVISAGRAWGHATWGDGSTSEIIPLEDVEVLTLRGSKFDVQFDRRQGKLVAEVEPPARIAVATQLQCVGTPCRSSTQAQPHLVARLWDTLAPVARLVAAIFN